MIYTVCIKKLPEKAVISKEKFTDLNEAINSADYSLFKGSSSVEVTVVDETGSQHYNRIFDNS